MSFTAVYSELVALDLEAGERRSRPPRILDYDAWRDEDWHAVPNMQADTLRDLAIIDEEDDYSEYPKREWKVLKGFKTWKPKAVLEHYDSIRQAYEDLKDSTGPLGFDYNIERVGIPYEGVGGVWQSLFAEISRHTEPFAVYHSPYEHRFPDVTMFADGTETVYYIEAVDGEVYAEEQTFRRTDIEALTDDTERVADHEFTYPD